MMKFLKSLMTYGFIFILGMLFSKTFLHEPPNTIVDNNSEPKVVAHLNEKIKTKEVFQNEVKEEKKEVAVIEKEQEVVTNTKKELDEVIHEETNFEDKDNFYRLEKFAKDLDKKQISGEKIKRETQGEFTYITEESEEFSVERKVDRNGNVAWDKVTYRNGVNLARYYNHFGKIKKSIVKHNGRRILYSNYNQKNGNLKNRWVHLQNGDILFARYHDGAQSEFWKLPKNADEKKGWQRVKQL